MTDIFEVATRARNIDIKELLRKAIFEQRDLISNLNAEQMKEGKTSKNKNIRPKYSDAYLKQKNKGSYSLNGTPDLFLTGSFQEEITTFVEGDEYFMTSFDEKTGYLTEKYADIFGLTKKNVAIVRKIVTERVLELYAEALGL